jgi:predicted nicotinamide N-methyase
VSSSEPVAVQSEAQLYDHTCELLKIHESLLKDSRRNLAFYEALKASVKPGSSVLDVGSGTGIWAITAAKLGAKRVVAVEQQQLLVGLIRSLARQNGVADRVEVVHALAQRAQFAGEFDVVISETVGHLIFDEDIVEIMIDARQRFLKPNGTLIPRVVALVAAPARLKSNHGRLPVEIDLDYSCFESLLLNAPIGITDKSPLEILGEPRDLVRVDLSEVQARPDLTSLKAVWPNFSTKDVNGFVVWGELRLAEGIDLTTIDTSSWSTTVYPIKPFRADEGRLEFELKLTTATNFWTATLSSGAEREQQSYSPAKAATELLIQTRASTETLNHLKGLGQLGNPMTGLVQS